MREMVDTVDWAELNFDLLVLVAKRIEKIEDFVSFASVCTSWRAAAAMNNFKGLRLWQRIPCLMLPMGGEDDVVRRFYSLLDDEIVAEVSLPNFKGKRCIESLGWFLSSGQDEKHSLLNPFTGHEIQLPGQTAFPQMDGYIFMRKMVLSARPDETAEYILMVICGGMSELAFWRPRDKNWTRIKTRRAAYSDVTFYDGKFYAIDVQGFLVVCNPAGSNPRKGQILARIVSINQLLGIDVCTTMNYFTLRICTLLDH
jgi:hypothetical protein